MSVFEKYCCVMAVIAVLVLIVWAIADYTQKHSKKVRCSDCVHLKEINGFGLHDCDGKIWRFLIRPRYCKYYKPKDGIKSA